MTATVKLTKGQRFHTAFNVLVVLLYAATAISYALAGRYALTAVWGGCSLVWVYVVLTWVRTYRLNNETAMLRRWRMEHLS